MTKNACLVNALYRFFIDTVTVDLLMYAIPYTSLLMALNAKLEYIRAEPRK